MALRSLMIRKKLDAKKAEVEKLRSQAEGFEKREAELEQAINEAETEEEQSAVEEEVEKLESEKTENETATRQLEEEIKGLEQELADVERSVNVTAPAAVQEAQETPSTERNRLYAMKKRDVMFGKTVQEREAFFARGDVKEYIENVRTSIANKRDITNVGLTIPEVMIGILRENIEEYSKLYKHVNVVSLNGTGREIVQGTIPEGIWTECCGVLNELSLTFNDVEVDCFKVGGYFKVCNATLEDSDIDLASTLLTAIGQAIGFALDKAILYGKNSANTQKMPLGIVSRLAQTEKPSDYPATARTWADLHASNIIKVAASKSGADLFKEIVLASGNMKSNYSRDSKVWVMNDKTYTTLMAEALSVNAAGAVVTGVGGTMPVVGGAIEVLDFVPDNVIIGGYFDLYLLGERAGNKFATSEHVFFIQDQTVMKGTARYDGLPVIAEGFVVIGINGTAPTATMTFTSDEANKTQSTGSGD